MNGNRQLRVLHVVHRLDRGGVETWLVHLLRRIDRSRFAFDFLVHSAEPGAYDDEVRALGANIYPCLNPSRPISYARNFQRVLRDHGPYSVVHGHLQHFNGIVMGIAAASGVPIRLAHSHLDSGPLDAGAGLKRRAYLVAMRRAIDRFATLRLAASRLAGDSLFLRGWDTSGTGEVLYCGIDPQAFGARVDCVSVRKELSLPPTAFVVGHVANFRRQKNHGFLVDVAAELAEREPCAHVLLVGDGPERDRIEAKVSGLGLRERVHFAGQRSDIPGLMLGAMDAFVLPSLSEGLPLVGIEAQAAGLPTLLSDAVTNEVAVVPGLVRHLSLATSPAVWADALLKMRAVRCRQPEALAKVAASPFNIAYGSARLEEIYAHR
jgi:glycosyltransferase involved in cell wall biosynthesis